MKQRTVLASVVVVGLMAGTGLAVAGPASAHDEPGRPTTTKAGTDKPVTPPAPGTRPGTVTIVGDPVENIRANPAPAEKSAYCAASSLPAGEGVANKGGTCVSTPLGEIAVHPVRVTANAPGRVTVGQALNVRIRVADNQGILDLNAFTKDATGGAGTTFLERAGELDASGRPLLHCHIGLAKVASPGALPPEDNDAAFSGVQGVRGDLTAKITGLPRGFYTGSVWCSQPGHPILPTAVASRVQAIDTFDVQVTGRGRR